jgi:hypothetical protein
LKLVAVSREQPYDANQCRAQLRGGRITYSRFINSKPFPFQLARDAVVH